MNSTEFDRQVLFPPSVRGEVDETLPANMVSLCVFDAGKRFNWTRGGPAVEG